MSVHNTVWLILFIPCLFVLPLGTIILFAAFSFLYTMKKAGGVFGIISPLSRGLQNGAIAFAFNPYFVLPTILFTSARNLIGDFRDAGYDHSKKAVTLPVWLGIKTNQVWAFYGHVLAVVATTVFWFIFSPLPIYLLSLIILAELLSYPFTPRASNPGFAQKLSV